MVDMSKPTRVRIIGPLKNVMELKTDQTLMEFGAELKQLSDQDCEDLAKGLEDGSMTY
jgi:hypothetical protein